MGDIKGFLKVRREETEYRPVCERIKDYREVIVPPKESKSMEQASRCMDCGTPFCNWGCTIGNYIPEWNDLLFNGHWKAAFELLDATNTLPEITGRICPAPCEYSCVLGINDDPVTIRENELAIIEYAFRMGWVTARPPKKRSGRKVAVIGSGPAGLSAACELNRAGHKVAVFERDDEIGGIMRYGIPDFKLEKWVLDRRIKIWEKGGIEFKRGVNAGIDYPVDKLKKEFDVILLAGGCRVPRDLKIEGRDLKGIYFAMEYLTQSNRRARGEPLTLSLSPQSGERGAKPPRKGIGEGQKEDEPIDAKGKKVVVIGGGDTGADCVGTAHRQNAGCVIQIELLEKPPECRTEDYPWPRYPMLLKTSTSHEEGGERHWSVLTKRFMGAQGRVKRLSCVKVEFSKTGKNDCPAMREIPNSGFEIDADMVILAVGFAHPEHGGLVSALGTRLDSRGNIEADTNYMTSEKGIFSAGDMRRGQSLIVHAIFEGRNAAYSIDKFLMSR